MVAQVRLGEMLIAQNIITDAQLRTAIERQKKTGEKIGQALIALNYISEKQFLDFFSEQLHIPFYDLRFYEIDPLLAQKLPESLARLYSAIILKGDDKGYLVGMVDPLNVLAIDKLQNTLKKNLSFGLVKQTDLEHTFNLVYRHTKEITDFAQALSQEIHKTAPITIATAQSQDSGSAPIIKLLNTVFKDASQMNASDIHIEPNEKNIRIRLRIDGMLHEQILEDASVMPAIASRIKLMSGLNISEKRIPQDGRFSIDVKNKKYDVRVSTMPAPFGESIVLRLLPQNQGITTLDKTGMSGEILKRMRNVIRKPNGIILVTGPTGSGKSTTLYAAINEINRSEIKIITIEDPIEYFLSFAVQIQTNEQIGLTFATILRGILRHDPDVILLGEMRDKETSMIAMRTALTGRLVLSTLHTNDAISTIYRLNDLGVEPYITAATVQAILAQRLIRLSCPNCLAEETPSHQELLWLEKQRFNTTGVAFKKGKGCSFCAQTGYHGRTAIFELLEFDDAMADALRRNKQEEFHQLATANLKGSLLMHDAYRLVLDGKSTLSEMIRVANESVSN